MTEPIEMLFGLWAGMRPKNQKLGGAQIPLQKRANFLGKEAPIIKCRDFLPWAVQKRLNRSIYSSGVNSGGPNEAQVRLYSPGGANVPDDTLPWVVQKRLNRSVCRLGCGLGWAEGSTSSVVFARWRQCALMPTLAIWRIRLNRLLRWCGLMSNYFHYLLLLLPVGLPVGQTQIFRLLRGRFWGFLSTGSKRCTDDCEFGVEE